MKQHLKIGTSIQTIEAATMVTHKCSTCKFCKQCTETEKRLSGKGAFCYDYEDKETDDDNKGSNS